MPRDRLGSGAISEREKDERVIAEAVRRVKLEARNDGAFVPPADDASSILAARAHVLPPPMPERAPENAQNVLAERIFGGARARADSGTPLNIAWRLVQRDGVGSFAASVVQVKALRATTGTVYDFELFAPDGTTEILRVPVATTNLETLGDLKIATKFGCNGKAAQAAVSAGSAAGSGSGGASAPGGTAGGTYTATEQALLNALLSQMATNAGVINALASVVTAHAATINVMRTALIANGILV